jgi:hypothetical protein
MAPWAIPSVLASGNGAQYDATLNYVSIRYDVFIHYW